MRRRIAQGFALLVCGFLISLALQPDARANGTPGNDYGERYRDPWPERVLFERQYGCPVQYPSCNVGDDCYYHNVCNAQYEWAIDLNNVTDNSGGGDSDCGNPLRATRLGSPVFFPMDTGGYHSSYLGIIHPNGPGDFESTWYTHVDYPSDAVYYQNGSWHTWDTTFAQGDFVSRMGKMGTSACHLHFYLADGQYRSDASFNQWMSGYFPWTGYDLQHLSDDNMTGHASNNTGAGYGRPYSGTCPPWVPGGLCADRGPDNAPLVSAIRQYARDLAAFTVDPGSTRASIQGPCGANRRWVKGCYFGAGGYRYSQSFVLDYLGLQIPSSITEGYPAGTARRVTKAMWKAYGRRCTIDPPPPPIVSAWVYEIVGRPTSEEYALALDFFEQDFELGHLVANRSDAQNVYVSVYDNSWGLVCSIGVPGAGGFYDWLDIAHEPCQDVNGDGVVNPLDVVQVIFREPTYEWDPINDYYVGYNYDDRYDVNRDGAINALDDAKVQLQINGGNVTCR